MTTPSSQACIALGANLGDPLAQLRAALAALDGSPGLRLCRVSAPYRTAPVGVAADPQPDFINAVALFETTLAPHALLARLFEVEQQFGRRRDYPLAPRTLDLDLLLYDALILDTPQLVLPHPRMHLRAFVLHPLLEIVPDCRIPGRGAAADWLPGVSAQAIARQTPGEGWPA